jgi:hypothetical protein
MWLRQATDYLLHGHLPNYSVRNGIKIIYQMTMVLHHRTLRQANDNVKIVAKVQLCGCQSHYCVVLETRSQVL